MTGLLRTPLLDRHAALGAKRAPFAGYDMPVFYRGIYDEAAAVRTACGVFDVSHMARLEFPPDAEPFLEKLLTCDLAAVQPGGGSYGLILSDDGGILDDVILYRRPDRRFLLVVNASNHAKISAWIRSLGASPLDLTADTVMLAVQGPKSEQILSAAVPAGLREMPYFGGADLEWSGLGPVWISRTGYTGEDGFEISAPAALAEKLWNWIVNVGSVAPCGLGARDVLRVEAGYSLYGSDMNEDLSPYDCGLGFAVTSRAEFRGAAALKTRPVKKRPIGIDAGPDPSVILRHGYPVLSGGKAAGEVTSGIYSKTLSRSIAFALVDARLPADASLTVSVRGREVTVRGGVSRRFIRGRVKPRRPAAPSAGN